MEAGGKGKIDSARRLNDTKCFGVDVGREAFAGVWAGSPSGRGDGEPVTVGRPRGRPVAGAPSAALRGLSCYGGARAGRRHAAPRGPFEFLQLGLDHRPRRRRCAPKTLHRFEERRSAADFGGGFALRGSLLPSPKGEATSRRHRRNHPIGSRWSRLRTGNSPYPPALDCFAPTPLVRSVIGPGRVKRDAFDCEKVDGAPPGTDELAGHAKEGEQRASRVVRPQPDQG